MTAARLRALALLPIAALGAAAIALWANQRPATVRPERPLAERPALLLLTALPLVFGEEFSLGGTGSPALDALRKRFRVVPISTGAAGELARGRLLMIAQPRAQRAEDLVAIDHWVRSGGRMLLLADPALEWPSDRALGDPVRPPPSFADTGLLGHWGLRLDAPDETGPRTERIGRTEVMTGSPGILVATGRGCRVESGGLVARCRIGQGRATIVADADILDLDPKHGLDGPTDGNLAAIVAELAALEQPDSR